MERGSAPQRPPASKFQRLAIAHALMMGGDAAMVVALADSLFFDIDLDAARSRVLLFLVVELIERWMMPWHASQRHDMQASA